MSHSVGNAQVQVLYCAGLLSYSRTGSHISGKKAMIETRHFVAYGQCASQSLRCLSIHNICVGSLVIATDLAWTPGILLILYVSAGCLTLRCARQSPGPLRLTLLSWTGPQMLLKDFAILLFLMGAA